MLQKSEYSLHFTIISPSIEVVTDVSTMLRLPFTRDLSSQVIRSTLRIKFLGSNRTYELPYPFVKHSCKKNCKTQLHNFTASALLHKNTIHTYFTTTKVLSQIKTVLI